MLTGFSQQHKPLTVLDLTVPHPSLAHLLSPDERARAERFQLPHLRERFCLGRGTLRVLLGIACSTPPEQIQFAYSAAGKPCLPDFPEFQFNVSHSGDLWACIIVQGPPVGLDIERAKLLTDRITLARRFFSPAEYDQIERFPEPDRQAAFYRCWTRKEAYLKATGEGLSRGLATFTVSCGEEQVSEIDDCGSGQRWFATSFTPAPGYTGAIVTPERHMVLDDCVLPPQRGSFSIGTVPL